MISNGPEVQVIANPAKKADINYNGTPLGTPALIAVFFAVSYTAIMVALITQALAMLA